jgi:predicted RNA-binding protein with PIN domain
MQKRIYIIDGYNVIHRVPRWEAHLNASLEQGREALLSYCRRWMQTRGDVWLFYVVFDGDCAVTSSHTSSGPGIRVVYTRTGETADDRMLDIMREFGEGCDYVAVSDDRYVSSNAKLLSAETLSARDFAEALSPESKAAPRKKQRGRGGKASRDVDPTSRDNTAGKVSPHDAKIITDSLRREWNV